MQIKPLIAAGLIAFIFSSCNRAADSKRNLESELPTTDQSPALQTDKGIQEKIPVSTKPATTDSGGLAISAPGNIEWDKKIIKTATLKFEVKDFKSYSDKLHQTIRQYGGYIAQEDQSSDNIKTENTVSIKVPVAQFETMMNQLCEDDVKTFEKKVTTDDVTGDVADAQARLEAKKAMRAKYLDFLKQSNNATEALQVQAEINNIQEEIESAQSRTASLSHQSAYSTLNLTFFQNAAGSDIPEVKPTFFSKLSNSFMAGVHWMGDLFVGIISIWPLLLLLFFSYAGYKKLKLKN